jgi:hypothetical protein
VDDFAYYVYTAADERFWFRLEREAERDIITDYVLGSFPREEAGELLVNCYRVLGLVPNGVIIFRDILSGKDPDDTTAVNTVRRVFSTACRHLLSHWGAGTFEERLETVHGKCNLVLSSDF